MQYVHDQDGLRKSYQSPFLLKDTGSKYNKIPGSEGGRGLVAHGLDQPDVAVGGFAATGTGIGLGLLLVWLLAAWFLILISGLLAVLIAWGSGGSVRSG